MLTYIFIGLVTAISIYAFNRESIYNKLMMNPYAVAQRKEYYRFLSSGFIHNGFMHLLFNMVTFFFFGLWIEEYFVRVHGFMGYLYFAALFLAGIIVADIPTYLRYRSKPYYNSLGASGGVASVVFACILYNPVMNLCVYGIICLPGFILGVVYLIYSYFYDREGNDHINHSAHLYGALFGFAFGIIIYPPAILHFFEQILAWKGLF
jgi:membrane associated rhomboid family serine protease